MPNIATDRIRLRENFACEFLREGVVFISETGSRLLTGRAERLVARYLDGSLTLDRIIERLHSEVSAAEVCFVVERLKRDGVVVSGPRLDTPERGWEVLGAQPETVGHLREAEIEIVSVGDVGASAVETVAAMVRGLGARIVSRSIASAAESSTPGVFTIVVVDDYLRNALDGINAASLASGRPWLLVKPIGVQAWVGPFFTPGETGCWQCVAQRLRGHRRVDEYLRQRRAADDVATVPLADLPGVTSAAAGFAATAVGKWFVVGRSGLEGALWVFDSATMDWRRHRLVKRPQCPVCGDVARPVATDEGASRQASKANASLQLVARRCGIVDGGFRVASPEQTFERLKHHISPLTGIVSALVDLSDEAGAGRAVGPNFLAHHAFTTGATDVDELRDSLQRAAGGKGLTAAQAQASALCEALERYSGVFDGTETFVRARMRDLGEPALHPNASMLFSERQLSDARYPDAAILGRRTVVLPAGPRRIPARFDPDAEIDWTPVWSLTHERLRYLPTAYCYYGTAHTRRGIRDRRLERLRCRERDRGSRAAGFPGTGRAGWHRHLVVQSRRSPTRRHPPVERFDARQHDGSVCGPGSRNLGARRHNRPRYTDLRGGVLQRRLAANAGPSRFWRAPDAQVALRRAVTELVQSLPSAGRAASPGLPPNDPGPRRSTGSQRRRSRITCISRLTRRPRAYAGRLPAAAA